MVYTREHRKKLLDIWGLPLYNNLACMRVHAEFVMRIRIGPPDKFAIIHFNHRR